MRKFSKLNTPAYFAYLDNNEKVWIGFGERNGEFSVVDIHYSTFLSIFSPVKDVNIYLVGGNWPEPSSIFTFMLKNQDTRRKK